MDIKSWRTKSNQLQSEIVALYLPYKHPRTPWHAKVLAGLIIGYVVNAKTSITRFSLLDVSID